MVKRSRFCPVDPRIFEDDGVRRVLNNIRKITKFKEGFLKSQIQHMVKSGVNINTTVRKIKSGRNNLKKSEGGCT